MAVASIATPPAIAAPICRSSADHAFTARRRARTVIPARLPTRSTAHRPSLKPRRGGATPRQRRTVHGAFAAGRSGSSPTAHLA